jgi:MSHA pilin protein MshA
LGLGDSFDEELESGIRIRYGYPFATQENLKKVLNFTEDEFKLTGSNPAITFTLTKDTEDLSTSEIDSADVCKLVYTRADKGERPDITISGCVD